MIVDMDVWNLIIQHEQQFKRIVASRVHDPIRAEECLSDIQYEATLHAIEHFDETVLTLFKTFLMTTFRWYVVKWLSGEHKRNSVLVEFDNENEAKWIEKISYTISADETVYIVLRSAKLSDFEKLVLDKRYKEDLSFGEIGKQLGYAEATIRSHHHVAICKLRETAKRLHIDE